MTFLVESLRRRFVIPGLHGGSFTLRLFWLNIYGGDFQPRTSWRIVYFMAFLVESLRKSFSTQGRLVYFMAFLVESLRRRFSTQDFDEDRLLGSLKPTSPLFGHQILLRLSLFCRVDAWTVGLKIHIMYEEHLCAVALSGSPRGFPTHPLASYFPCAILHCSWSTFR